MVSQFSTLEKLAVTKDTADGVLNVRILPLENGSLVGLYVGDVIAESFLVEGTPTRVWEGERLLASNVSGDEV